MAGDLRVQSKEMLAVFSMDLTTVLKKWDEYNMCQRISSKTLDVGDLKAVIDVYPKSAVAKRSGWAIYVRLIQDSTVYDRRNVTLTMSCNSEDREMTHAVSDFFDGLGWLNPFPKPILNAHPVIRFQIDLQSHRRFRVPTKLQHPYFEDQLEKLYEMHRENGDLKLIVSIVDDESKEDYISCPPRKRRKLDDGDDRESDDISTAVSVKNDDDATESQDKYEVRISSAFLRAASPVFDQLLSAKKEQDINEIAISAKRLRDVEDLAYFVTTNKLRDDANVFELIHYAHLYQIKSLFLECSERIIENVQLENYVETVKVLDKYNIERGFPWVVQFGKRHIKELRQRDDFIKLPCSFRTVALEVNCWKIVK